MATTINAGTTVATGLNITPDTSGALAFQANGTTALSIDSSQNISFAGASNLGIPVGTTAQRPSSPTNGMIRYNTTTTALEGYIGGTWVNIKVGSYSLSYLAVAGGAGGGNNIGGGGGAGQVTSSSATVTPGTVYTITVGAGGGVATNGSNSSVSGLVTATGGTRGGDGRGIDGNNGGYGGASGNGFGGGGQTYGAAGGGGGASGGGGGGYGSGPWYGGGGGPGLASSITGSSVTYGGGGGGAGQNGNGGGGSGGGGSGGPGSANTGGGGGGGWGGGSAGGSGVVILSMPTANYSGVTTGTPTISTSGSNTILKFTASGTYTS